MLRIWSISETSRDLFKMRFHVAIVRRVGDVYERRKHVVITTNWKIKLNPPMIHPDNQSTPEIAHANARYHARRA